MDKIEFKKLPPEFKAKWVEALRSGNYDQGLSYLYNSTLNSYCCLGVACNLLGYSTRQLNNCGMPSHLSDKSLLISQLDGDRDSNSDTYNILIDVLSRMNDGNLYAPLAAKFSLEFSLAQYKKYSFLEIADFIEKHL